MVMNPLIMALAALIPLVIGFVWYHPKVLGTAWMKAAGMTEEQTQGGNMAVIFGLTYVFSFFGAVALTFMCIHQNHIFSIFEGNPAVADPNSEVSLYIQDFMAKYGTNFRTFKHGVVHGILGALFLALPLIGVNALFERKGFKYIAINIGFWIVSFALMGGIICQFS